MSKKYLSVIIPSYNDSHRLQKAIKKMLKQSHLPLEIIIIDDGSKDGSVMEIKKLKTSYSSIKLIQHSENLGVVSALNTGIKSCSGDVVYLSSTNDYISNNFFRESMNCFTDHSRCHVFCSNFLVNSFYSKKLYIKSYPFANKRKFYGPQEVRQLFDKYKNLSFSTITSMYSLKSILNSGGLYCPTKMHSDWLLLTTLVLRHGFYYSPNFLGVFEDNKNSYSAKITNSPILRKSVYENIAYYIQNCISRTERSYFQSTHIIQLPFEGRSSIFFIILLNYRYWSILSLSWFLNLIQLSKIQKTIWDIVWFFIRNGDFMFMYNIRVRFLRLFGARVGHGVRIGRLISISHPWKIIIGCNVKIESNVAICSTWPVIINDQVKVYRNTKLNSLNKFESIFSEKIIIAQEVRLKVENCMDLSKSIGPGSLLMNRNV